MGRYSNNDERQTTPRRAQEHEAHKEPDDCPRYSQEQRSRWRNTKAALGQGVFCTEDCQICTSKTLEETIDQARTMPARHAAMDLRTSIKAIKLLNEIPTLVAQWAISCRAILFISQSL